jgi:hypothetical protein
MPDGRSSTAKYLDRLGREARGLRPIPAGRIATGHVVGGALTGVIAAAFAGLPQLAAGGFPWLLATGIVAGCLLLFPLAGKALWNRLLVDNVQLLTDQVRGNLLDHELLLLCSSSELPAHYDKLRRVAQSYGKTRARNWEEIDRNSMRQRVQWLVENYNVVCRALGLPCSTAGLRRLRQWLLALLFLPLALMLAAIADLIATHGGRQWEMVLLASIGLQLAAVPALTGLLLMQSQLERGTLIQVLTTELAAATTTPGPTAIAAAPVLEHGTAPAGYNSDKRIQE